MASQLFVSNIHPYKIIFTMHSCVCADPSGRAVLDVVPRPFTCWDCGFEPHRRHGTLSVLSVVCCQVQVSATDWSLFKRSPTDCGASLCVSICSCSKAVFKPVWHIPLLSVQWTNSWWWAEELSETCRVSCQNKFAKFVYLVGFIIKKLQKLGHQRGC